MKKDGNEIIYSINKKLKSDKFRMQNRFSNKYFTRKRKMPFQLTILFMLNIIKQTLQKELTNFMEIFTLKNENITKSAFCQNRMKLKPEAFIELNDTLTHEFYTDNDELRWRGFRLLAVDGSLIQLPKSQNILNEFGCLKNQYGEGMPSARISTCYDILNEIILDSRIDACTIHEYEFALKHLNQPNLNDLLIYDRCYGAVWFMYKHVVDKRNFVMRMQRSSITEINDFFNSNEKSKILNINTVSSASKERLENLGINFKPFKIRLVKVILDNGELEVLATSLIDDKKYTLENLKELYRLRWSVEVNYNHLKNNLNLEDFTGLSSLSIKQDFFASMFIINLQAIIINDIRSDLEKKKSKKDYKFKANKNLSLGLMKDRIIKIFFSKTGNHYEKLKNLFKIEPIPIRPNRKNSRKRKWNRRKFHIHRKRAI